MLSGITTTSFSIDFDRKMRLICHSFPVMIHKQSANALHHCRDRPLLKVQKYRVIEQANLIFGHNRVVHDL